MEHKEAIINFEGSISFETMELLLNQLKSARQFSALRKPVRKRVYGTVVETIDNIFKYATPFKGKDLVLRRPPRIQVKEINGKFIVSAGNLIRNDQINGLKVKLNRVNGMDDHALKMLYEEVINKEATDEDSGAGLGLITLAMRTDNDIQYQFEPVGSGHAYFTMQITIKE
jgi:hypothetical protein